MQKDDIKFPLLIIAVILICVVTVYLTILPAFIPGFSLIGKGDIGDVIGGITAPIIGLVSAYLIYQTYQAQNEANRELKMKNEFDILLSLISRLDEDVNAFYYQETIPTVIREEFRYTGIQAIHQYTNKNCFELGGQIKREHESYLFAEYFEPKVLSLVLRSFMLVKERLAIAEIHPDWKKLIKDKLDAFYESRLEYCVSSLYEYFKVNPHVVDPLAEYFISFKDANADVLVYAPTIFYNQSISSN